MFNRSQKDVSDSSKHWYQDKYQHVLTQRNVLALVAIVSLFAATVAVVAVMRLAPLKSVEPYLLQIDEKSGITQRVIPVTKKEYTADEAVDRYFTALFLRMFESYSANTLRYNYNVVRLMSTPDVFAYFRNQVNPSSETGFAKRLGSEGQRDIKIKSMVYIVNPGAQSSSTKIMQIRLSTIESAPGIGDKENSWIITLTFEYADLNINQEEQWLNPLGYTVTSYQIQSEIQ
ncbi:MAG: type IV secretion system protein [Pseudomonadota bacterium]